MGNTTTKERKGGALSYSPGISNHSDLFGTRTSSRAFAGNLFSNGLIDNKRARKQEEKDRQREKHYSNLVVRYYETVDGGYLAPYGTYRSNLDYDTEIVRNMIINRRIAPFYTPLQDYEDSWTDEELLIILSQMSLHSIEKVNSDTEEDDIDNHKLHKSHNYQRRQEQKAKIRSLITICRELQEKEENKFLEAKQQKSREEGENPYLPSKDLMLRLYKEVCECPICFLYYPNNLNISRCCLQPICTECFVQIKRLDPHPPHEDVPLNEDSQSMPHTLISEPASCPYCAMKDFGVIYDLPHDLRVGIDGIEPNRYVLPSTSSGDSPGHLAKAFSQSNKRPRRKSLGPDALGVVTTDMIRTDWEQKLNSARNKLARKAATASAIHASSLIVDPIEDCSRRRQSLTDNYNTREAYNDDNLRNMEEKMIEEALRLSIKDEELRRKNIKEDSNSKDQSSSSLPE